jgi:hypothetical protein
VILAVGSDKGSPGATTLAVALGLVWPGVRLVCELDPRGADLPFRLRAGNGQHMGPVPSVATLAIDARPGAASPQLARYAQQTILGVPVIRGEVSTRAANKVAPHLPAIATVAASWPGAVITDLGSLQPSSPAMVVARAASIVLLVMRANTEGLGHLRDRIDELSAYVGDERREWTPVGVVLVADSREEAAAVQRTRALLDSVGSPAPVVGVFLHDPAGAAALWEGQFGKKITKNPLVRSSEKLVSSMWQLWPDALAHATYQAQSLIGDRSPLAGHR